MMESSHPIRIAVKSHGGSRALAPALLDACLAFGSSLELDRVLDTILDRTLGVLRAQQGSILLFDGESDRLVMPAARGLPPEVVARGYLPRKGSIAEWVIANDRPLLLAGEVRTSQYHGAGGRAIASALCVPLRARGRVPGVLNLNRTEVADGPFDEDDRDLALALATQAAAAIENSRLHERAVHAERLAAIGETVAGAAHCIKNMLTALRGGLAVAETAARAGDAATLAEGHGVLRRAVDRVSGLALDMLDLSKPREPELGETEIAAAIEEVVAVTAEEARRIGATLDVRLDEGVMHALADPAHLVRCLANLVHNALHAAGAGGWVRITASPETDPARIARMAPAPPRRAGGEAGPGGDPESMDDPLERRAVAIRVADSGSGVPPEVAARLFQPFFSTKGGKGTGLGLSVSRKLMREAGGTLELESPPGSPAVFLVLLRAP